MAVNQPRTLLIIWNEVGFAPKFTTIFCFQAIIATMFLLSLEPWFIPAPYHQENTCLVIKLYRSACYVV